MGSSVASARIVRFGVFEVDLKACELRKHGYRLKLSEQPFQVLAMLLERPGEVVTREEMRSRLWAGDTFVDFDHGLNNAVMRVREVLLDSSEHPRYVETLPRRGYRFVAPVEGAHAPVPRATSAEVQESSSPSDPALTQSPAIVGIPPAGFPERVRRWATPPRAVLLVIGMLAIVALSLLALREKFNSAASASHEASTSLVVLPLENLSGDKDQDYFADGMTDELIANLAKIRSLHVISRSTAMAYKGTRKPLSAIARELNVDAVVEGTVLRVGDRVRITAELVQVSTDHHLWADTYESQIGDVLALQNRVSSAIVNEIRINLTPEERERLAKAPAVAPEAYENYLKGLYYWNKRSDENLTKAIGYFERATRTDPEYALAHAGLSDSYAIISAEIFGTMAPAEAAPKAKAAALRALQLDPTLAEAETSLATVKFNYDWDWNGAAEGFARAIELNPSYATAYQRYSLYLIAMGRAQDSFSQIQKARALDPLSISINFSVGWRLYMSRKYDQAIAQLQDTLEMDPSYELPHLVVGQAYSQKSDYAHAIPELAKAVELSHGTPLMVSALAYAYGKSGNRSEAERLLASLESKSKIDYVSPYYLAVACLGLGQHDQAINWLEKALADRSNGLVFLQVEPELDDLRSDPRFIVLQQRLRFPKENGITSNWKVLVRRRELPEIAMLCTKSLL